MHAITDGGMETTLIYKRGAELPHFASFVLLAEAHGTLLLREYYAPYLDIARDRGVGAVLDTATWRANPDWGQRLGYSAGALAEANRRAVELLQELRAGSPDVDVSISGCVGPRGDGYAVGETMTADEAADYHAPQAAALAAAGADLAAGLTLTYAAEAIGVVRAAGSARLPAVVSFTVETDGRLPSGQPLAEAIEEVDHETKGVAEYFMVNCAHPTHFREALTAAPVQARVRGVRANASLLSHEELDAAEELDEGDPEALATEYAALRRLLPGLAVVGGCCGTDDRHVAAIAAAVFAD